MSKDLKENNKLIAEFMGYRYKHSVTYGGSSSLFYKIGGTFEESFPYAKYHKSWDWLMPVVEKIENLGWIVVILNKNTLIGKGVNQSASFNEHAHNKLAGTYNTIIKFIEYFNTTQS